MNDITTYEVMGAGFLTGVRARYIQNCCFLMRKTPGTWEALQAWRSLFKVFGPRAWVMQIVRLSTSESVATGWSHDTCHDCRLLPLPKRQPIDYKVPLRSQDTLTPNTAGTLNLDLDRTWRSCQLTELCRITLWLRVTIILWYNISISTTYSRRYYNIYQENVYP